MAQIRRRLLIVGLSILAALTIVSGAASVTALAYQNRIHPQTLVAGESVGGLTPAEAQRVIERKQAELAESSLTISYNGQTAQLLLQDLGVSISGLDRSILARHSFWDWLDPGYWASFFGRQDIGLAYEIDQVAARQRVEEIFGVAAEATNAALVVADNQLNVIPGQPGESLEMGGILGAIAQLLKTGQLTAVTLAAASVEPLVSTEAAARTKSELESGLQTVYLAGDDRNFTIPVARLYELLDYEPTSGGLKWQVSDERLREYLSSRIAARINLRMLPKTIQSDTQQVTQEGRDGKVVDLDGLVADVKRTITEQIDTREAPVEIKVASTAFTERIVHPDYIPGLFEGLYLSINLTKQRLFVMDSYTVVASYVISSGKPGTPTPVGTFYILNKHSLAQSRLFPGIWMEKWNALTTTPGSTGGYQGYGLHRVPCFDSECNVRESLSHLGRPVSAGCVRIENAGADWVYDHAPIGTPVHIHR
jgi:hypothetical protein